MDPLLIVVKLLGAALVVSGSLRLLKPQLIIRVESSKFGTLATGLVLLLSGVLLLLVKQSNIPSY